MNYTANNIHYFNSYDPLKLSDKEWKEDVNRHAKMFYELRDQEELTPEQLKTLLNDNYCFWLEICNRKPYKRNNQYMIKLTLSYINRSEYHYIDIDAIEELPQCKNYL